MDRDAALKMVWSELADEYMRKHVLAVEAVMKRLAKHFGQDESVWGLAGLLHDLDYEKTRNDPENHGKVSGAMLREAGVDAVIVNAVMAHAGKCERDCLINRCIYAADPVTGLVTAAALIRPEKKLEFVTVETLQKRFKEKRFAVGADRERIRAIEAAGLSLPEFLGIALNAMKNISSDLGL